MTADTFMMTDLESRLAAQEGAATRDDMAAALQQTELRLRRALAAGLPISRFAVTLACAEAVAAAREVLHMQVCADDAAPQNVGSPLTRSSLPPASAGRAQAGGSSYSAFHSTTASAI